jgi:hypothetical protein
MTSSHKVVVEVHIDGCPRTDHKAILAYLTYDIELEICSYRTRARRDAFDKRGRARGSCWQPQAEPDRLIEE